MILSSDVFRELYTGSCPAFLRCLFRPEPAAVALPLFVAHASYNLYSFRDSANGVFLFRQFAPAPCSPPLGGSITDSAVRFTPAVNYGGRENWPSGRETRCIRYHPCRAHHKLKWARTEQSVLGVLYELFPRSESSKAISAQSCAVIRPKASPKMRGKPRERWRVSVLIFNYCKPAKHLSRLRRQLPFQVIQIGVPGQSNLRLQLNKTAAQDFHPMRPQFTS